VTRLAIFMIWLFHWLPLSVLSLIGQFLGTLSYFLVLPRKRIAATNLALCFPELDASARRRLLLRHFQALGRSVLERGLLWWSSPERLRRIVRFEGEGHLRAFVETGTPVILLAPHFIGLDAGGARIAMSFNCASMYSHQKKDPVLDYWLYRGRKRFGDQILLSRQDGVRGIVRALKSGRPFYYLPDMDYGRKDSVFVPFFGVEAATITGLPRLTRLAGARVLPCVTRMLPGGAGYVLEIGEAWENFPTADIEADTRRMNDWVESVARTMPEQYYWVHRRFKTRPDGHPRLY